MRHTTITCDRCKSPIRSGLTRLATLAGPPPHGATLDDATGRHMLDLCDRCTEALGGFLADRRRADAIDPPLLTITR